MGEKWKPEEGSRADIIIQELKCGGFAIDELNAIEDVILEEMEKE